MICKQNCFVIKYLMIFKLYAPFTFTAWKNEQDLHSSKSSSIAPCKIIMDDLVKVIPFNCRK